MDERNYGSHLSVLRTLLAQHRPERVLEFGAGLHSTPAILERPEVTLLVSIEPDPEWRRKVASACEDPRLVLRAKLDVDPADYDFVFIDNGTCIEERLEALHQVLHPDHPLTVIHDADVREYRLAIEDLSMHCSIIDTDPPTAVAW